MKINCPQNGGKELRMQECKSIENLEDVLGQSEEKSVLLFKWSADCKLSKFAKYEIDKFCKKNLNVPVYMIKVQEEQSLSARIAEKLALEHQSPQVIILKSGKAQHHFNHFDILEEDISGALS